MAKAKWKESAWKCYSATKRSAIKFEFGIMAAPIIPNFDSISYFVYADFEGKVGKCHTHTASYNNNRLIH